MFQRRSAFTEEVDVMIYWLCLEKNSLCHVLIFVKVRICNQGAGV